MNNDRPADLVAIPPVPRTVIYYLLGLSFAVISGLVGFGILDPIYLVVLGNISALFFGVAGSNVVAKPAGTALVANTEDPELDTDEV